MRRWRAEGALLRAGSLGGGERPSWPSTAEAWGEGGEAWELTAGTWEPLAMLPRSDFLELRWGVSLWVKEEGDPARVVRQQGALGSGRLHRDG